MKSTAWTNNNQTGVIYWLSERQRGSTCIEIIPNDLTHSRKPYSNKRKQAIKNNNYNNNLTISSSHDSGKYITKIKRDENALGEGGEKGNTSGSYRTSGWQIEIPFTALGRLPKTPLISFPMAKKNNKYILFRSSFLFFFLLLPSFSFTQVAIVRWGERVIKSVYRCLLHLLGVTPSRI